MRLPEFHEYLLKLEFLNVSWSIKKSLISCFLYTTLKAKAPTYTIYEKAYVCGVIELVELKEAGRIKSNGKEKFREREKQVERCSTC